MSRSLSWAQAVVLGAMLLVGAAVAAFGIFSIGQRQLLWGEPFHLRAGFRQIRGVEIGTRVRVLGKNAGEVEALVLPENPSGQIELLLRLDAGVRRLVRADAVAQIVADGMVGGKVVEISPGTDTAAPIDNNALIASQSNADLNDLLTQVKGTIEEIGKGQGSIGRLVKEEEAYQEFLKLLQQGRQTVTSLKQDADAIKSLPIVRSYVQDAHKELIRPDCERVRQWFSEADLFETERAVLTDRGRQLMDDLASWLKARNQKGSEVVVVAYANPAMEAEHAKILTQKQAEAVCDYLTSRHKVQKTGWFSRRKVTPLGCGTDPSPVPDKEPLPVPRIEVVVFIPQT